MRKCKIPETGFPLITTDIAHFDLVRSVSICCDYLESLKASIGEIWRFKGHSALQPLNHFDDFIVRVLKWKRPVTEETKRAMAEKLQLVDSVDQGVIDAEVSQTVNNCRWSCSDPTAAEIKKIGKKIGKGMGRNIHQPLVI